MKFYVFLLAVLGVWRITHLINVEDGPGRWLLRLRTFAGSGPWVDLVNCFYCSSLWIAVPFALLIGESWGERLLLEFALSGGAILLERATLWQRPEANAPFWEEPETENGMLRKEHDQSEADKETQR